MLFPDELNFMVCLLSEAEVESGAQGMEAVRPAFGSGRTIKRMSAFHGAEL